MSNTRTVERRMARTQAEARNRRRAKMGYGFVGHPPALPRLARMRGVQSPYYRPAPHTNAYTRPAERLHGFRGAKLDGTRRRVAALLARVAGLLA